MNKADLYKLDAVELYKLLLTGKIKRFPRGFWERPEAEQNGVKIFKFLIEDILMWTDKDIKTKLNNSIFNEYKLKSLITNVFKGSPYKILDATYPNKFKPWELQTSPRNFWNNKTTKEATLWLIKRKLKWNDKDIREKFNSNVLLDNSLTGLLKHFNNSPFKVIDNAYPNRFKPWEIATPQNYWNKDTAYEAMKWLIEDKLKWNDEDIKSKLNQFIFDKFKLRGMLEVMYNNSTYLAINHLYPNRFNPWELNVTLKNYWNLETAKQATIWLIEDKLKWNDEEVKDNITARLFFKHGLTGMLNSLFNNSTFLALDNAYPGKFKKRELHGYKPLVSKH